MKSALKFTMLGLLAALLTIVGVAPANASTTAATSSPTLTSSTLATSVAAAAKSACCHITVPSNYVYNPNAKSHKTLHDYCSYSPDQPGIKGTSGTKKVDFRGSCARHDLCMTPKKHNTSACDSTFGSNLQKECKYKFPTGIFYINECRTVAAAYAYAVKWKHNHIA